MNNTHYCFTAGKDGVLRYWDADRWELLLELRAHHSEVWCCAVSLLGDFVVTGGHDKSLRRWERTDEPFFIEEEREKRLESLFEADLEVPRQPSQPFNTPSASAGCTCVCFGHSGSFSSQAILL